MGGRITKARRSHHIHETKLTALERRLATEAGAVELAALARELHGVVYALGHDIPALIAMPGLADRAARGKLAANEKAALAYARAGNLRHALFHLYEALETGPARGDRARLVDHVARMLDGVGAAAELRASLAALPDGEDEAKAAFAQRLQALKYAFDWDRLPTCPPAD